MCKVVENVLNGKTKSGIKSQKETGKFCIEQLIM